MCESRYEIFYIFIKSNTGELEMIIIFLFNIITLIGNAMMLQM